MMNPATRDEIVIRVSEVVGGELCIATDDGQRLHDAIATALHAQQKVAVSFSNIETIIPAFLNAATGQLYGEFPDNCLQESLTIRDIPGGYLNILSHVIANARTYFAHREQFDEAWRNEVGEDAAE